MGHKTFVLGFLLFYSTLALLSYKNGTHPLPQISSIQFVDDQILYLSQDQKQFGFLSKETGDLIEKLALQSTEKILSFSKNQIMLDRQEFFLQYLVKPKQYFKLKHFSLDNSTARQIIRSFPFGRFILSGNSLSLQQFKANPSKDRNTKPIQILIESGEQTIDIQKLENNLLILTSFSNKFCLRLVNETSLITKKCIQTQILGKPSLKVSFPNALVNFENHKSFLFDQSFNLIQKFDEQILQFHKGFLSFAGFKTYEIQSKNFKTYKLVAHENYGTNSFSFLDGQYLLKEGSQLISKISGISSTPKRIWLNKREAVIGKIQGKYELLVQTSSGSLQMYKIIAQVGQQPNVVLVWSK